MLGGTITTSINSEHFTNLYTITLNYIIYLLLFDDYSWSHSVELLVAVQVVLIESVMVKTELS